MKSLFKRYAYTLCLLTLSSIFIGMIYLVYGKSAKNQNLSTPVTNTDTVRVIPYKHTTTDSIRAGSPDIQKVLDSLKQYDANYYMPSIEPLPVKNLVQIPVEHSQEAVSTDQSHPFKNEPVVVDTNSSPITEETTEKKDVTVAHTNSYTISNISTNQLQTNNITDDPISVQYSDTPTLSGDIPCTTNSSSEDIKNICNDIALLEDKLESIQ